MSPRWPEQTHWRVHTHELLLFPRAQNGPFDVELGRVRAARARKEASADGIAVTIVELDHEVLSVEGDTAGSLYPMRLRVYRTGEPVYLPAQHVATTTNRVPGEDFSLHVYDHTDHRVPARPEPRQ